VSTDASRRAGTLTAGVSVGEGWPEAATPGQSPLIIMCSYVFATLGRRHHPNFAMPDDKALIVDRQKVELEAEARPRRSASRPGTSDALSQAKRPRTAFHSWRRQKRAPLQSTPACGVTCAATRKSRGRTSTCPLSSSRRPKMAIRSTPFSGALRTRHDELPQYAEARDDLLSRASLGGI
jgi:hypothetical protein